MNRYLSPGPEGELYFRGGRRYRLLLIVNGSCDVEDVEDFLSRNGFAELASSMPDTWHDERPDDWPAENLGELAANECALRTSAVYTRQAPLKTERDMQIGNTRASLTVAQAWDYGDAGNVAAGAAPAAAPATGERSPMVLIGAAVAGLAGLGIWQHVSAARRMDKARAQMFTAETRAEQLSAGERMQELMDRGYSETQAARTLDQEEAHGHGAAGGAHAPQVIYVVP